MNLNRFRPTRSAEAPFRRHTGTPLLTFAMLLLITASANASWYKHVIVQGYHGTRSVYAKDMDLDGDIDVVGAARYDNLVGWWENAGDGTWNETIVDTTFIGAWEVHAEDIDNDNRIDIIGSAMTGSEIAWWANTPDGWVKEVVAPNYLYSKGAYAADFNEDGLNDILACSYGLDRLAIRYQLGDTWYEQILAHNFYGARSVYAADVDADGDLDAVSCADSAGVAWWENDSGNFTRHDMPELIWGARSAHAADLVGDSRLEILCATSFFEKVIYWSFNDDTQTWELTIVGEDYTFANDVTDGDVDNDGDIDILACSYDLDRVTWWENLERTGEWAEHDVATDADGARAVDIADVNGDGENDILCAVNHMREIAWWEWDDGTPLTMDASDPQPALLPPEGGEIEFTLNFTSTLYGDHSAKLWQDLRHPDGSLVTDNPAALFVLPTGESSRDSFLVLDEDMPAGEYTLLFKLGASRETIVAADSLSFVKEMGSSVADSDPLPREFETRVSPNPFNSRATVALSLPRPGNLSMTVNDILGRRVVTLAAGPCTAGQHQFTLDLSRHAAGIYLLHIRAHGETPVTRKLVLLK